MRSSVPLDACSVPEKESDGLKVDYDVHTALKYVSHGWSCSEWCDGRHSTNEIFTLVECFEDEQPRSLKERIGSKQVAAVVLSALAKAAGSRAFYE